MVKKKKEEGMTQKEKFVLIFMITFCVVSLALIAYFIGREESQTKDFKEKMKKTCKSQGWELTQIYYNYGAECREIKESYVTYYTLEIINNTIYVHAPPECYNLIINHYSQDNNERRYWDDNIIIPMEMLNDKS